MNVVTLRATVRRTSSNMTRETGLFAVVECHTHSVLEDLMHTVQKETTRRHSMPGHHCFFFPSLFQEVHASCHHALAIFSRIALESTPDVKRVDMLHLFSKDARRPVHETVALHQLNTFERA